MLLCGGIHLRWCHQCVQRGQKHQQALYLLRAVQRHTIEPDVITYHGAICVCKEGQQHQQALRLLRVIQYPAIMPVAITYIVAVGACGRTSRASSTRPGTLCGCCSHSSYRVMGNEVVRTMASHAGQLMLNYAEPVMIYKTLSSIDMPSSAFDSLTGHCVKGIVCNKEHDKKMVRFSLGLAMCLLPFIGYKDRHPKLPSSPLSRTGSWPRHSCPRGCAPRRSSTSSSSRRRLSAPSNWQAD